MQRWILVHVDFCAGGGRFQGRNAIMSLSAMSFCLQILHLHGTTTSALENIPDKIISLAVNMPHCGLLTTQCDEHHHIQTFKSGELMLGFGIYYYSYVMGWWWDLLFRSRKL